VTRGSKAGAWSGGSIGDRLAILLSFACLVHCLALPLLLALLPAWSAWLDVPDSFHFWVVMVAAPLSLAVLVRSAGRFSGYPPLWLGAAGLALLTVALLAANPLVETLVTSVGALTLAWAHVLNWRARHRQPCGRN